MYSVFFVEQNLMSLQINLHAILLKILVIDAKLF